MRITTQTFTMKWYLKFLDCLLVSIAVVDFYNSLVLFPAVILPALHSTLPMIRILNFVLTIAALLFLILCPILWQKRENEGKADSPLLHAWFTGVIRYWLTVEILNYGFAKVLGTQFAPSYYRSDSVWNTLSGLDLTWNYFSYSYAMSVIIAGIQIVGSVFLLFRRTTIAGIILLLPVMLNIVLIDIFYAIPTGALLQAILFTIGLLYLLLLQWNAIRRFFIAVRSTLPAVRLRAKNVLRLLLIAYAFCFIYLITTTRPPAGVAGKWRVDLLIRNGDTTKADDWLRDSLAWKNIYLEDNGGAIFSPNPYIVETARGIVGIYTYTPSARSIRFILHPLMSSALDTFNTSITAAGTGHMQWKMIHGPDTVFLTLTNVPEHLHH